MKTKAHQLNALQMAAADARDADDSYALLDALELGVRGYACHVFDDPRVAWLLHREQHLIPWRMESDLRVDRFDARNLLDDRTLFRQLKKPRSADDGSSSDRTADSNIEHELHALRYCDYEVEFPRPAVEIDDQPTAANTNAFAYAYPEDRDDDEGEDSSASHRKPFAPPWIVPAHILKPKSKKLHDVIAATAKKARAHPQLEVMLKVKLHTNATFRFLAPTHGFHAYYVYLRDEDPPMAPSPPPTMSLLGAAYDDDDDDEESDDDDDENGKRASPGSREQQKSDDAIVNDTKCDAFTDKDDDDRAALAAAATDAVAAKKAARLERAKRLASHFARAATATASATDVNGPNDDAEHKVKRHCSRSNSSSNS